MKKIINLFVFSLICLCGLFTVTSCKNHKHNINIEEWSRDSASHWHACDGCDELADLATHEYGEFKKDSKECKKVRICTVCGFSQTQTVEHTWGAWANRADGSFGKECTHCHTVEHLAQYYVKGAIAGNTGIVWEKSDAGKLSIDATTMVASITLDLAAGDQFKVGTATGWEFNATNITLPEGLEGTDNVEVKVAGNYTITVSKLTEEKHVCAVVLNAGTDEPTEGPTQGPTDNPTQGPTLEVCDHVLGITTYTWSADNTECIATAKCSKCNEDVTEKATITSEGTANCTTAGKLTYTATFTNSAFTSQTKEIDSEALGHDEVSHEAQEATCTEKGWAAYVTCSRCEYTTYEEIQALGHDLDFGDITTECKKCQLIYTNYYVKSSFLPTTWSHSNEGKFGINFSNNSMVISIFIKKGDIFKVGTYNGWEFNSSNSIKGLSEYFVEAETDQNIQCEKTGVYRIVVSNNQISFEYLSESCQNHEEIIGVYLSNATGHWSFCVNCRVHKFDIVNHLYKNDSTCDIDCEVCGFERTNATSHTYDNACDAVCNNCSFERIPSKHEVSSTCDEICNVCGTEIEASTDHTYDNACDAECNLCDNTRTTEEHKFTGEFEIKTAEGHAHKCDICQFAQTISLHTPGAEATETTAQTCTDCGYILVPATAHECVASTAWEKDDTKHWHYCQNCTENIFNEGPHEYDDDTCDTTCNTCGYLRTVTHDFDNACDDSCNHCEYTRITAHKYENIQHEDYFAANATCTSGKTYYKSCSVCGKKHLTETFAVGQPTNHSYVGNVNGTIKTYKCSICNDSYTKFVIFFKVEAWGSDSPLFWAHVWNGAGVNMQFELKDTNNDGIFEAELEDKNWSGILFVRAPKATGAVGNWNEKWNQTQDLTIPTDGKNMVVFNQWDVDGKSTCTWSTK